MKCASGYFLVICVIVLSSCTSGKLDQLVAQNDSLRIELKKAEAMISNYRKIASAVDSLDGLRKAGIEEIKKQTHHETLASKILAINHHVIKSEEKIDHLDKQLKSSSYENSAYIMMVDALKGELQIRVDEVTILEGNLTDAEKQSVELLSDKDQAIKQLLGTVSNKQVALSRLSERLNKIEQDFRNTEADAVYARAQAVEQSARKTRFAPVKKKVILSEALELYKKARLLGKSEAEFNIEALEKGQTSNSNATASTL
jgi:hypothetical protein